MRMQDANELAARLRRARPALAYFPHRYAAWLLGRAAGEGTPARSLKASRHRRLLENELVRRVAARAGDGQLSREVLDRARASGGEVYRIGLGLWGPADGEAWEHGWYQTTRPGANLVLLLNFSPQHNAAYRRWLDPKGLLPMVRGAHPHAAPPDVTMAWARLDVDLAGGEALVEEIQSDWIRDFDGYRSWIAGLRPAARRDRAVQRFFRNPKAAFEGLERYCSRVLVHHRAWWAEATLFATLWLLFEQLRIRRIYYHTHEGGMRRKGITGSGPPRSLYTTLPRRFGFELTSEGPSVLRPSRRERRRRRATGPEPPWYRLEL